MAFLTVTELNTVSRQEIRDMITRTSDPLIVTMIDESIDKMKGYLMIFYNATAIFDAIGEDRSLIVLKYLKDIVIYELYSTDHMAEINQIVYDRYLEAMKWLEDMAAGKVSADLPGLDADGDGVEDDQVPWLTTGASHTSKF